MYVDNCGHKFVWGNFEILDQDNLKKTNKFSEACHSGQLVISRLTEIYPISKNVSTHIKSRRGDSQVIKIF